MMQTSFLALIGLIIISLLFHFIWLSRVIKRCWIVQRSFRMKMKRLIENWIKQRRKKFLIMDLEKWIMRLVMPCACWIERCSIKLLSDNERDLNVNEILIQFSLQTYINWTLIKSTSDNDSIVTSMKSYQINSRDFHLKFFVITFYVLESENMCDKEDRNLHSRHWFRVACALSRLSHVRNILRLLSIDPDRSVSKRVPKSVELKVWSKNGSNNPEKRRKRRSWAGEVAGVCCDLRPKCDPKLICCV